MKIFIHGTPLPLKYLKKQNLIKNNFEDFNKPFLFVKDTFKNTFKKTIKEKYLKKYQTQMIVQNCFLVN